MALPKPATPTYELTLPSTGKTIKYRPFLVKEEKVLLLAEQSEDEKQIKRSIVDVIKACIISRVKVEDLPYFDLEYIFLQLRARSAEEIVQLTVPCKDDPEVTVPYNLNLLEVEVEGVDGMGSNKIMIGEDCGLIMKYPGIDDFVKFVISQDTVLDEEITEFVAERIEQIFDAEEVTDCSELKTKEIIEWLGNLTQKQFVKIGEFYENLPKLRHKFTITNPNTGFESEYTLEGLNDFFV